MDEHAYSEAGETNVPSASSYDPVNVPLHYNHGKIEVINVIMALGFDNCEGNVAKYVMRHRYKNGIEDIEKSIRYVQLMIDNHDCLLYTSPSPRDGLLSRMPSSA